MKRFRFESFMRFIIQSPEYGTFTEAARTDPEQYSHDTWRDEFINMDTTYELFFDYRSSHIRSQSFILLHRCGSTTPSSKNKSLETNLKPPPMKLFQNPNS